MSKTDLLKDAVKEDTARIIVTNGVRVKICPVSSGLISDIMTSIKDPDVPMWANPDKDGRLEENPNDPEYLRDLEEVRQKRTNATSDAMVMFGIELVDGLPPDSDWLAKLKYLAKRGAITLDGYNLEDKFDQEFLFKKFVVASNTVVTMVTKASGVDTEAISREEESFPGN